MTNTANTSELYSSILSSIHHNLLYYNYKNALFLSLQLQNLQLETQEPTFLVAHCYYHLQKYNVVYEILLDTSYPPSCFLFAKCCIELNKYREAESTLLLLLEQDMLDKCQIKDLLGLIQSKVNRNELAIVNLHSCLTESPLLWTSFEKLCELGYFATPDAMSVNELMDPDKMNGVLKRGYLSTKSPVLSNHLYYEEDELKSNANCIAPSIPPNVGIDKKRTNKSHATSTTTSSTITNSKKRTRTSATTTTITSTTEPNPYTINISILAQGYQLLSNYKCHEALNLFLNLDESLYQTAWVQNQIARAYYELNEYEKAQVTFERVREMEPWRLEYMDIYATCLWHLRKDVQLSFLAKELDQFDRLAPETWCVLGNLFSRALEHDQAIKCFNRATQVDPYHAYGFTLCGHEYMLNEDLDRAANCFRNAIRIQSRHYNAWYGLASVFLKQEKYDLAEYHFKRALSIYPNNPLLQSHLAMVIQKNPDRLDEALLLFENAERLAPKQPIYTFRKAHTLTLLGRYEEGLYNLKSLVGHHVAECNVHYLMGRIYKMLGNKPEAIKCFTFAQDRLSSKSSNMIKEAIEKVGELQDSEDFKLFE